MTDEEKKAAAAYAEAGVDVPELKGEEEKVTPPAKPEPKAPAKDEDKPEAKVEKPAAKAPDADKGDDDELLPTPPKEEKKRSIYDDYKDKKSEAKSEKDARIKAEAERDELAQKLKTLSEAKTPEEKKDAKDELEKFAEEINADPETLRKMRSFFLKGIPPAQGLSEEDRKILAEAKAVSAQHQKIADKQRFDDEFTQLQPAIKELFPTASPEELTKVKERLDSLAHSVGWNDKDLDYILFKNKDKLSTLISPKKRGLEGKGRKEADQVDSVEFDPNADISKMSQKERDAWEADYKKLGKNESLVVDAQGRKLLI